MWDKNIAKPILISFALIIIASLVYALGTSMLIIGSFGSINQMYLLSLIIFMPIGFILFPYFLSRNQLRGIETKEVEFKWGCYLAISLVIFILNHYFIHSEEYFHQLIISMCEEFLFRYVIYSLIRQKYNYSISVLLTALLFGLILHMNYPFVENLCIRTPLGIIFSILATKFGLQYAVAGHWIYNLVVSNF